MAQLSTPWDQAAWSAAPSASFEFFPPRTPEMEAVLWRSVHRLAPLNPDFVSVTYGAGGSTRQRTHDIVCRLQSESGLRPAAHLTCVGATRPELEEIADRYWEAGIRHIVALRGDLPADGAAALQPGAPACAADLVELLRGRHPFEISVAAHPETHPDAVSPNADLENLKRKLDAGASRAITQFFFDVDIYLRFRDRAAKAGIDAPLVPGVLPVTNFGQLCRFAKLCGASLPGWLAKLFDGLDEDPETRRLVAMTVATEHCRRLLAEGVKTFHFYTLNRAELTFAICRLLGIVPQAEATPRAVYA